MSNYKQIFVGIFSLCVLLVASDIIVGSISKHLYESSKYSIFHRQLYCMNESNEDIIILGSPRAAHHYVPSIFTDTL